MKTVLIASIIIWLIAVANYPKWSYKAYYKRCKKNSTHPDWTPYCGKNFLNSEYFKNKNNLKRK